MALGCMLLSMHESQQTGLQWFNLFEAASPDDNFAFFYVLIMFAVDAVIYFLLAVYIENVFPGPYGYPKKWYYFVDPNYWSCNRQCFQRRDNVTDAEQNNNEIASVKIEQLSKSYDNGKSFAVNKLNLEIKRNEITILIGHNGSGMNANFIS